MLMLAVTQAPISPPVRLKLSVIGFTWSESADLPHLQNLAELCAG
jgi:hypothetical protein